MDADEALRRLRAADPASDVDGTWDGSPAQARAAVRQEPSTQLGRGRVLIPAGAAAAVVAAIAISVSLLPRSNPTVAGEGTASNPPTSVPSSTPPTSSSSPAPGDDPRERAEALLTTLLAGVEPLPGALPSDTPPDEAVKSAPEGYGPPNVLEHDRWWTAPGSVNDALQYYRTHTPDDLTLSGTASRSNTKTGEVGPESLMFDYPDTSYAHGVQVLISVIAHDGGVAVGAYTIGVWIPERDPAFTIVGATSVDVTVRRDALPGNEGRIGAPTVHRTLDGAVVDQLAQLVNALPVELPSARHCPNMAGIFEDKLVFATQSGPIHVLDTVNGCPVIGITLPGGQHGLFASGDLDATLMELLGLPKNYGRS